MPEINMKTDYDWEGRMRSGREGQKKKKYIYMKAEGRTFCVEQANPQEVREGPVKQQG